MQKAPKSKTIDGHVFQVGLLPGRLGFSLQLELVKMIGPALGAAAGKLDVPGVIAKVAGKKATEALGVLAGLDVGPLLEVAVSAVARGIDTPKVMELVDALADVTLMNGRKLVVDADFAGEPFLMAKWLYFALGATFGGFFDWKLPLPRQSGSGAAPVEAGAA